MKHLLTQQQRLTNIFDFLVSKKLVIQQVGHSSEWIKTRWSHEIPKCPTLFGIPLSIACVQSLAKVAHLMQIFILGSLLFVRSCWVFFVIIIAMWQETVWNSSRSLHVRYDAFTAWLQRTIIAGGATYIHSVACWTHTETNATLVFVSFSTSEYV